MKVTLKPVMFTAMSNAPKSEIDIYRDIVMPNEAINIKVDGKTRMILAMNGKDTVAIVLGDKGEHINTVCINKG